VSTARIDWEVNRSATPGWVWLSVRWFDPPDAPEPVGAYATELPMAEALRLGLALADAALAESREHR
jgi:hypothetical protein